MSAEEIDSQPLVNRAERYPLLCLDIDGVCSPVAQNPRFHCHGPPLGFVDCGGSAQVHPALPAWVAELERAFRRVCWISTWRENCAEFAQSTNLKSAVYWPYIDMTSVVANTGIGKKLNALAEVTDPGAAVAVVDDHLTGQFCCDGSHIPPRVNGVLRSPGASAPRTPKKKSRSSLAAPVRRYWLARPAKSG